MTAARGRTRDRAATMVWLVVVVTLLAGVSGTASGAEAAPGANPVVTDSGGARNVMFHYGGGTPLSEMDLTRVGGPAVIVTTGGANDSATVQAIHGIGAKAYRYVQFFWAPNARKYEGIDLARHPGWAFCRKGASPLLGRRTGGERWYYLDANEAAVRSKVKAILAAHRAAGWDGVMFDRGAAATQAAIDDRGRRNWYRPSSCTRSPHERGASLSDAYVSMLGLAHDVGLKVMLNNGRSPHDPVIAMRPNPRDDACRRADWTRCSTLSDTWRHTNLVLNETATRPKAQWWERTFFGNRRSERSQRYGGRTVALITTASLGGERNQTRAKVFYAWSRVKLFNVAVGVNTGEDGCRGSTGVCNRHGTYPELVRIAYGKPLSSDPSSRGCIRGSAFRCVWTRAYAKGINVLNATPEARRDMVVRLQTPSCRYVYDAYKRTPLAGNRCVRRLRIDLPAWSGRPLIYQRSPW